LLDNNKNYFVIERIISKLIPAGSGTRHLGVQKEISSGVHTHLLFTIYNLLFTIIIFMANGWFFINDICLVHPEHKKYSIFNN